MTAWPAQSLLVVEMVSLELVIGEFVCFNDYSSKLSYETLTNPLLMA